MQLGMSVFSLLAEASKKPDMRRRNVLGENKLAAKGPRRILVLVGSR
jgi:hypothetical protein